MHKELLDIEFKAENISDDGTFEGYGSTFGGSPDSYGDVIERGAFSESLTEGGRNGNGIAFLWQHNADDPIGIWEEITENNKGLKVRGKFAMNVPHARDKYELLKMGAVKGLSIGYNFKSKEDYEYDDKKRIRRIKKVNLWEISLVTFPANTRANVSLVKQLEDCTTEREFERVLRDAKLPSKAAKYIVSQCKNKFRDERLSALNNLLLDLRSINKEQ